LHKIEYSEFPCDISMYLCIITELVHVFYLLPTSGPFLWWFQQV
jgi:hypothetical protein